MRINLRKSPEGRQKNQVSNSGKNESGDDRITDLPKVIFTFWKRLLDLSRKPCIVFYRIEEKNAIAANKT